MKYIPTRIYKIIPGILLVLAILILSTFPARAATFEEDYQGYLSTYEAYKTSYQAYITTRSQYLTYGTLTSKNEALTAVKDFLVKRNSVLTSHLSLLGSRNTDPVYGQLLTTEQDFYANHSTKIPAIGSLEDAVSISEEVEKRNISLHILSKKVLATIIMSKINALKLSFTVNTGEANTLIATLKSSGKEVATLERWLQEAKNKELLASQKLAEVAVDITKLTGFNEQGVTENYNKIQGKLTDAYQYMREANTFLKELAEAIKYGNY